MKSNINPINNIILFDGECNLCSTSVRFIINHDPEGTFRFASLQSDIARKILKPFSNEIISDSVILIQRDNLFQKSEAALNIAKHLNGFHWVYKLFSIFPKRFLDLFYRFIAQNRHRFFGKRNRCMIPTPDIKNRFL